MIVLALDTALAACSVAVVRDGEVLAARSEAMLRGHQERLAPLVAETMAEAGIGFAALDRIGVAIGPGSFTGVRVGLAFAKGLSVALAIPCVGIGTLEALAASAPSEGGDFVAAVIDARRDQIYLQAFSEGRPLMAPDALEPGVAAARLAELWSGGPAVLVGPGAALLESVIAGARINQRDGADPVALARLAAAAPEPAHRPRPLYLRGADARTIAERAAAKA